MTGKLYYMTTLGAWREHCARFATSHFIVLDAPAAQADIIPSALGNEANQGAPSADCGDGSAVAVRDASGDSTRILVLVEADEGAHLALEDDARFEALPHPLAHKLISHAARAALSAHDVPYGATTFDVAEAVSRTHPLLRHRVF